jgi:hypothetical protein
MLPFAAILAVAALAKGWSLKPWLGAATAATAFLCLSGLLNTAAALDTQPIYREFLSGMDAVDLGSHVLPVIADMTLGGNQYIPAMGGIETAYNIVRGGSDPNCFAEPAIGKGEGIRNGAMLLRFRHPQTYYHKFLSTAPNFRGVSRDYDAVIIFGNTGSAALARQTVPLEMHLAFTNGRLAIYKR